MSEAEEVKPRLSVKIEPVTKKSPRGPKKKELTEDDKKKLTEIAEKRKKNIADGVSKPKFTERDYEEIAKRIIEKKVLDELNAPKVVNTAPKSVVVELPEKPKPTRAPPKIIPEPVYKEPEFDSDDELNELLANITPSRYGYKADPGFYIPPRIASQAQQVEPQASPVSQPASRYGKKR